jgi:hypothetical protein
MKTRQKIIRKIYMYEKHFTRILTSPLAVEYSANYSFGHNIVGYFYSDEIVKYDGFSTPEIDRTINKGTLHFSS